MNLGLTEYQISVLEKPAIKCADVEGLLCDLADGELSSSLRARVEAHIECCPGCKEMAEGYMAVVSIGRELREKPVELGVQNRLREKLNRQFGLRIPLIA